MNCLPDDPNTIEKFFDSYTNLLELMFNVSTSYDDKSFIVMLMSKIAEKFEEATRAFIISSNFLLLTPSVLEYGSKIFT